MARIMITLQQNEREALLELSQRERRDPRAQAALIIRDGLQHAGLLPADTIGTQAPQAVELHDER